MSFVSTFLDLGFTTHIQNHTNVTQHYKMLPCPEGTYSLKDKGCVECPPGILHAKKECIFTSADLNFFQVFLYSSFPASISFVAICGTSRSSCYFSNKLMLLICTYVTNPCQCHPYLKFSHGLCWRRISFTTNKKSQSGQLGIKYTLHNRCLLWYSLFLHQEKLVMFL